MMTANGFRSWELTHLAVRGLAAGTAPLSDRLRDAWIYHLIGLEAEGVPWPDLAEKFGEISTYFALAPDSDRFVVERCGEDDQRRAAQQIVEFYDAVCRRHGDAAVT